ncbi:hypothetical protein V2J09_013807 [Rumex salicifolius]
MKRPRQSTAAGATTITAVEPPPACLNAMDPSDTFFSPNSDLCQQLLDRYSASSAVHHRHLLATAAAMRSILLDDSLPLTPLSYFAATITATSESSDDAASVAALTTFLSLILPLVPPGSIAPGKAVEAVEILVTVLDRPAEVVTTSSAKCLVKCLGVVVGFCDSSDWNSVKSPVQTLLRFSMDKRPKVRKCAQVCLENALKSFQCPSLVKRASKLILSLMMSHIPVVVKLGSLEAKSGHKKKAVPESDNSEALHVLNIVKLAVPHLNDKISLEVVLELLKLLNTQHFALTRPVLEIIEAFMCSFGVDVTSPIAEDIIAALSILNKYPKDTIVSGSNLLSTALNVLHSRGTSDWIKNLPLAVRAIAGVLVLDIENDIASQASNILKHLISGALDKIAITTSKLEPLKKENTSDMESTAIASICSVFDDLLVSSSGTPNEYILSVLSVLFLKLAANSYDYIQEIILKLSSFMKSDSRTSVSNHLQKCIGCAITAAGPEYILELIPISLDIEKFSCSNTWLLPVLKNYIIGASLTYFMEFIVPLADSIDRASGQVKKSVKAHGLQAQARALWGLLPAFCRHPADLLSNFESLANLLVSQLEKDSYMHEDIAIALQELVKQNTCLSGPTEDVGGPTKELNTSPLEDSLLRMKSSPSYTKEVANNTTKTLAMGSRNLLVVLTDLFLKSSAEKRTYLKETIRCLVSVSDSLITHKIFISSLEKFEMITHGTETRDLEFTEVALDKMSCDIGNDVSQGCLILELASSIIKGADEDLVAAIYRLIKHILQAADVILLPQAYYTLSQILEEHSWFCSSQFDEVVDLLLGLKVPDDVDLLKSRMTSFHVLLVHALESKEETRKSAYDVLLKISSNLFDSSGVDPEGPYYRMIKMMMGYVSSSSPHIISGAISALSMLVYKEPKVSLSIPELVPSITTLLLGKAVEVVKSALGFVKVLVSCLEPSDLHGLLPEIVDAVLPWSSVSRHHFRSKVIVIFEIIVRKCGPGAVEPITPGQYRSFLRNNRHGKNNSKETQPDDATQQAPNSSSNGPRKQFQKHTGNKESGAASQRKNRGMFGRSASVPGKSGREQQQKGYRGFNKRNRDSEQDSSRPQKKMKNTSGSGDDWKGKKGFAGTKKGNHPKNSGRFKGKNK